MSECRECGRKAVARQMCPMHYRRWRLEQGTPGTPLPPPLPRPRKEKPECSIGDCKKSADSLGLCEMHYTRKARYGDPLFVKRIAGDDRARFESYVDRSAGPDACHPWTGGQCTGGYGQISIKGRLELVHIVAWQFANDLIKPRYMDLDHECHNRAVRTGTCQPGICPHRLCCNAAHLAPKTKAQHREDTADWYHPRGSAHGKARLNEEQVREIRRLLRDGSGSQHQIAQWYRVSDYVVSQIKLGKSWAWLPED